MTQQEYKEKLSHIKKQEEELADTKQRIRNEFLLANAKFGVGDKIYVIHKSRLHPFREEVIPEKRELAFIDAVHDNGFTGTVQYRFRKSKKDGSKSANFLHPYGYDRIELIEAAANH